MNAAKCNLLIFVFGLLTMAVKKAQSFGNARKIENHVPIFKNSRNYMNFRFGYNNNNNNFLQSPATKGKRRTAYSNAFSDICTHRYANGEASSNSVGSKAEELKFQAAKTRLEAQKMELNLTLKKVADFEAKIASLKNPVERIKYEDLKVQIAHWQKTISKENDL